MVIQHYKRRAVSFFTLFIMLMLSLYAKGSDTLFLDIPLGQERCLPSGNVCVGYDAKLSDNRCPIGIECFLAGKAKVRLLVNGDTVILNTADSTSKLMEKTGYIIRLREVHPYPVYEIASYLSNRERYLIDRRDSAVEVALIRLPVSVNLVKAAPVLSQLDISGANGIAYEIPCATRVVIQIFSMQGKCI